MAFKGSCVALVTPFKGGKVDDKKLRELVEFHVSSGTDAIVPCGTTGESATLSHAEHARVIEIVIRQARKRVQILAGAGSNSTQEAIELARHAKSAGADGVLSIVPYYNKPTQGGMIAHFAAVARAASVPIVIYNIPGRTGVNMLPETLLKLALAHKNIVGVKESTGNLEQVSETARLLEARPNFQILSGDDSLTLPILSVGGCGVISVLANIAPQAVKELCESFVEGNIAAARALHLKTLPLIKALFSETNPAPVKAAMAMLGLCGEEMRLPMVSISTENRQKLKYQLQAFGLKKGSR